MLASNAAATAAGYALGTSPSLITANVISNVFQTPMPENLKETIDEDLIFGIARQERYGFFYHLKMQDVSCDLATLTWHGEDIFHHEADFKDMTNLKNSKTMYNLVYDDNTKNIEIVLSHKGGFMSPYWILGIESEILQHHKIEGGSRSKQKFLFTYKHPYEFLDSRDSEDYFVSYTAEKNTSYTEYEYLTCVYAQIIDRLCSFEETPKKKKLKEKVYFQHLLYCKLYTCCCDHFFCTGLDKLKKRKELCSF